MWFEPQAVRAGVLEHAGVQALADVEHLVREISDLPLCAIATALVEEVQERSEVHSHDYLRRYTVREQIAGVFGGDAIFQRGTITVLDSSTPEFKAPHNTPIFRDALRHDDGQIVHADVPLALLAVACYPVPHELMTASAGAGDMPRQAGMFQRGLVRVFGLEHAVDKGFHLVQAWRRHIAFLVGIAPAIASINFSDVVLYRILVMRKEFRFRFYFSHSISSSTASRACLRRQDSTCALP